LKRNYKWTFGCWTILTEFRRFQIVVESCSFFKSSLLYIEVWEERYEFASTSKKSRLKLLINHQWFIAWYGYCPMKDQFEMQSMYEGTLLQAELVSLSYSRDKLCVVEVVVVHFVQLYFVNALQKNKHPMPLNPFELVVALLFHSFVMLRRHWIHWTAFEALSLHLLMNYSFWWFSASDEHQLLMNSLLMTRHYFRSTLSSGALWLQEQFSSDVFKLPFCLFLCSLLFFQNLLMISKLCLWSCTLEEILAYPIDNFLIPCYHQNS